jgi:hypothetical protein
VLVFSSGRTSVPAGYKRLKENQHRQECPCHE